MTIGRFLNRPYNRRERSRPFPTRTTPNLLSCAKRRRSNSTKSNDTQRDSSPHGAEGQCDGRLLYYFLFLRFLPIKKPPTHCRGLPKLRKFVSTLYKTGLAEFNHIDHVRKGNAVCFGGRCHAQQTVNRAVGGGEENVRPLFIQIAVLVFYFIIIL